MAIFISPGGGAPGADGKTVLNGSGAPSAGLGTDGDFYINTTASTIYGPKTGGAWGSPTSLVGPPGPAAVAGKIPSTFIEYATPQGVTSATLIDVPNSSASITLDEPVEIMATCSFELETISGAAQSVIALAINIDGVDHAEHQALLSGTNDKHIGAITHRTGVLSAGTYEVKLRYRRVSGTATPGINNFSILAMAMQGALGPTGPSGGGTKTLARFTPRDNQPPAANFATLDTRNSVAVLEFDAATEESAVFVSVIPEGANLSSGLLVRIWFIADTATTGNVRWAAAFERSGTDLDADSFDSATEVTSAANGTSGIETVAEITCTTIDSLAAGERFRLRIARKAADAVNDTMTGDAQIVAVEVRGVA